MNKSAQAGPLAMIFLIFIFLINWALWLGEWLSVVGQNMVEVNHITGLEAFFYSNLNMIVLLGVIFGMMAFMYFGGGRR